MLDAFRNETEQVIRRMVVLVADDDPSIRSLVRHIVEALDMTVLEASDGREVFDILAQTSVDLLILDLVMPNCEGIETINAIRAYDQTLPILVISGAFEGAMLLIARRLGANMALPKPFTPAELATALHPVLGSGVVASSYCFRSE
jgi:CheY-like chemotaxis protein